ncbi:hypothetical protein AeRB84_004844 [Aphanomyces euteiches]|nr:hypothetical protein AeRB84_004844 [Aphanomyces euteiches]
MLSRLCGRRVEPMNVIAVAPVQSNHQLDQRGLRAKRAKAAWRIFVNLQTLNTIFITSILILVLVSIGFFKGHDILDDLSIDYNSLRANGQSCQTNSNGFITGTCTLVEIATTTEPAWTSIGKQLARQWDSSSTSPYFVTTCIKTKPTNSAQSALVFLAGYNGFPKCQPSNGPQEIAGIAMLETTVRDEYADGVYMLTVFTDKIMSESVVYANSDGSTDLLIANISQTLIAPNGSMTVDLIGVNGVQYAVPLGEFFKISTESYPVVIDISHEANPRALAGWNIGQFSKRAVMITWNYRHDVKHRFVLVFVELFFLLVGTFIISGDFYLTHKGLRGFLANKPVMTFDLGAGLERRKMCLVAWISSNVMSRVYPDLVLIYNGSTRVLWFFVMILMDCLFVVPFLLWLALVTCIPSPFRRVLTISTNAMIHLLFVCLQFLYMYFFPSILDSYQSTPLALSLNISGVIRPSGAYANGGKILSAADLLLPPSLAIVASCFVFSIGLSTYQCKKKYGTFLLDLRWARSNGFLKHCGIPNWITGLPLDEQQMIKMGNQLYIKPSTQATLGFATVVTKHNPSTLHSGDNVDKNRVDTMTLATDVNKIKTTLVSVYSLPPILLSVHPWLPKWIRPVAFGTVEQYKFTIGGELDSHKFTHHTAGIAMLETTVRDEFPGDLYMLTNHADKTMPDSDVHVNSDDSADLLIANINQTLFTTKGSMETDNFISCRARYNTTYWKAVVMTWNYGHNVDHGIELVGIELGFLFFSLFFISGDLYLIYKGLKGFLADKPVMTYDVSAELERR